MAVEPLPKIAARTVTFSAYANQAISASKADRLFIIDTPVLRMADTKLRGSHNIENLMATLAVGLARGLSFEQMLPPLCAYEPRPHRCEFVREVGDVTYINDSKATNLDAVEKGLLAQNKTVILIAGGKDKGFTFETLRPLVSEKVRAAVLIGEMAERIAQDWKGVVPCQIAHSLADAVERARRDRQAGRSRPLFSGYFLLRHVQELRRSRRSISCLGARLAQMKLMKLPQLLSRKKLRATTARRALGAAEMDYEEMSEPNMKLSRALAYRARASRCGRRRHRRFQHHQDAARSPSANFESRAQRAKVAPAVLGESGGLRPWSLPTRNDESKVAKVPPKPVAKDERKSRARETGGERRSTRSDAAKTYVVAKGDNPVSIARKLKVPYRRPHGGEPHR